MILRRIQVRTLIYGIALTFIFCAGCSSNKYLNEGEYFLEENAVRIKSAEQVKNKGSLREDLELLYEQKETRTFVGIPRHWFYYRTINNPDTAWFKDWVRRKLADPPVIYDSTRAESSASTMTKYLKNKGYLNAEVGFTAAFDGKRARVTYNVDPRKIWTIRSLTFSSPDSVIRSVLTRTADKSFLSPGRPIDIELYNAEKSRITRQLQNLGYANFFPNFIAPLRGDSSDFQADVTLEVLPPPDNPVHQKFRIGKISVYPDYATSDAEISMDSIINGIHFYPRSESFDVNPRVITKKIYFQTGELYNRDLYDKTLRQLSRLEAYRFVSIKPLMDSVESQVINYQVLLTRNKKMGIGGEIDLNYSTLSLSQRSLMGTALNLSYRNRNIFRGAEVFNTNLEGGIELNLRKSDSLSQVVNSLNLNVQNSLFTPKFIDPIGFYAFLNNIHIGKFRIIKENAFRRFVEGSTRHTLGYNRLILFNFYRYHSLNASLGYDVQPDAKRRLILNHIGLDLFIPDKIERPFQDILDQNPFLRESFGKQLFTGFLFRDLSSIYSSVPDRGGFSYNLIRNAEISGLEVFTVNTVYNQLSGQTKGFEIGTRDPIRFSQFVKLELGSRFYKVLNDRQSLAVRLDGGLAFPFGPFSEQVPYVKQFYLGGPLSARAWQIRELGPGSYEDPNVDRDANLPFYQTGDIKLEFSAEYRFDLFWIFKGALFLDAGNIWTLKKDPDRPGSNFSRNFLDEIAIGTGLGARMDFKYFLIRLDLGYKLRQPYPDEEGRKWLFHNFRNFSFNQFNVNFALGYPF